MLRNACKRFASLALVVITVLSLLPASVITVGAVEGNLVMSSTGLTASYSGAGTWDGSGTTIKGSVSGVDGSSCVGSGSSQTTTLTLKNTRSDSATLSFSYRITSSAGTITVAGTLVTTNGTFSQEVAGNGEITIVLKSGNGASNSAAIELTDVSLTGNSSAKTTFQKPVNGSYTVNGTSITADTAMTQLSTIAYNVVATPARDYIFIGWYSSQTDSYIADTASASIKVEVATTIYPVFVKAGTAVFKVGTKRYTDLKAADAYATESGASKIVLLSDGSLTQGNYTISSGNILLIPFDVDETCYTDTPGNVGNTRSVPTEFRTLTLKEGAAVSVKGAISISAKHSAGAGGKTYVGAPSGPCGFIRMEEGSSIAVENGGSLYAWGYITGPKGISDTSKWGTVTAKSGSSVYEYFQVTDFRGGTQSTRVILYNLFPFSQYYVQNIEVPLTLASGAKETVYTSVFANSAVQSTSLTFIGNGGLFQIADGASITKHYDPVTDRLILDLYGDFTLDNISLSLGISINSEQLNLPINNNITLNIHSGTTIVNQHVALLPGVQVTVDSNATLRIAAKTSVYVYDSSNWGNYALSTTHIPVLYSPSRTGSRVSASLIDVMIDINGMLEVVGGAYGGSWSRSGTGGLYTTSGGANITSSQGGGKFIFTADGSGAGDETTTKQCANNSTETSIDITSAQLKNDDGSYTSTVGSTADTTYFYHPVWEKWITLPYSYTVTFKNNGGTSGTDTEYVQTVGNVNAATATAVLDENTFTRNGYTFAGWNTSADGSSAACADKETVTLTDNLTLYAQWKAKTYTVQYDGNGADDGSTASSSHTYGQSTPLTQNGFTKTGYTFVSWNTDANGTGTAYTDGQSVPLAGDLHLYAQWKLNVAQIGTTVYTSLEDAVEAAKDGDVITMLADTEEPDLTIDKPVVLDLNGHDVTVGTVSTTICGMDSTTDDLGLVPEGQAYIPGILTVNKVAEGFQIPYAYTCTEGAKEGNNYVTARTDDGKYSFHRVRFGIHQLIGYKNKDTGEILNAMTVRALFTGDDNALAILGGDTAVFGIDGNGVPGIWYEGTDKTQAPFGQDDVQGYTLDRTVSTKEQSAIQANAALKVNGIELKSEFAMPAVSTAFLAKMALAKANMEG